MSTALLAAGVDRLYWYLLRDYREFKGMGLLHAPDSEFGRYAPNPAYAAYANLIHQLGDARFVRREEGALDAAVYLFVRHGQEVRVAWTSGHSTKLRLDGAQRLTVLDVVGRQTMTIEKGSAGTLVLDKTPIYLVGNVKDITMVEPGELLTDSVEDYSDQQGKAGWSYGYDDREGPGDGPNSGPYGVGNFKEMVPAKDAWPVSWAHWRETGEFRDGTVLAKELVTLYDTDALPDGSTQQVSGRGYFMGDFAGFEIAYKSAEHFPDAPGNWAYFSFGHHAPPYAAATPAMPTDTCSACHESNAAQDFVFTQFYPVLRAAKPSH